MAAIPEMLDRTVTVNGFSKAYAMTGWRLGYMAAPIEIVKACSKLQSQLTSAPSSISQRAGVKALTMSKDSDPENGPGFSRTERFLYSVRCPKSTILIAPFQMAPSTSSQTCLRITAPPLLTETVIHSSEDLCFYLLDQYNVALVPGAAFGGPAGIRISYAASMADLSEAMKRLTVAFEGLAIG